MEQSKMIELILDKVTSMEDKMSGTEDRMLGMEKQVFSLTKETDKQTYEMKYINKEFITIEETISNLHSTTLRVEKVAYETIEKVDKIDKRLIGVEDEIGKVYLTINVIKNDVDEIKKDMVDIKAKQEVEYTRVTNINDIVIDVKDNVKKIEERLSKNDEEIHGIKKKAKLA